jgi:hypothetical protein
MDPEKYKMWEKERKKKRTKYGPPTHCKMFGAKIESTKLKQPHKPQNQQRIWILWKGKDKKMKEKQIRQQKKERRWLPERGA